MHSSQQMAATTWFDAKPVSFLSISRNPVGTAIARRWTQGVQEEISTTPQQVEYQELMKGVDSMDQMRHDYTTQFHSRKWWHKVMFFTVDLSLQNAWVLWCNYRLRHHKNPGSRLGFHYAVAMSLVSPLLHVPRTCSWYNSNRNALHYS
jgi:hypothetical protein